MSEPKKTTIGAMVKLKEFSSLELIDTLIARTEMLRGEPVPNLRPLWNLLGNARTMVIDQKIDDDPPDYNEESVVHILYEGRAICGLGAGKVPGEWSKGHQWAPPDKDWRQNCTCEACKIEADRGGM